MPIPWFDECPRCNGRRTRGCKFCRECHRLDALKTLKDNIVQPEDESIRLIPLTRGYLTTVDVEWFDYLTQWKWNVIIDSRVSGGFYASRMPLRIEQPGKRNAVRMHSCIFALVDPSAEMPDHIDGNGLNNCLSNLRAATKEENGRSQRLNTANTSGYKGVTFRKERQKWVAQIAGKYRKFIGLFDCPVKAAKAYDREAVRIFGAFAKVNFPVPEGNPLCR